MYASKVFLPVKENGDEMLPFTQESNQNTLKTDELVKCCILLLLLKEYFSISEEHYEVCVISFA